MKKVTLNAVLIFAALATLADVMVLNEPAYRLYKEHDRLEGRSCVNVVAGTGFEPATSGL